jgi:D-arginine dehydrogenase
MTEARDHSAEVLVIGAGIAGVSLAAELAPFRRVLVLEMEDYPCYHTTGRSAALFAEGYGSPVIRWLTQASRAFLEAPPPGFAEHALLTPRGWMFVADAGRLGALDALLEDINGTGGGLRRLGLDEVLRRVPILDPAWLGGAIHDDHAMDMDVHALHQGYLRQIRAAGGAVRMAARVEGLERRDGRWAVHTSQGDLSAPVVVNAAGAWADRLGELAGAQPIGLSPLRRTALMLDPPAGMEVAAWPMVMDVDETFYFKPDGGRLLLSPCDETPSQPCDAHPDTLDVAIAVDRLMEATTLQVRAVGRSWAGLRSFVADRNPVVGYDPAAEGFFWVAGQGGYGLQTAPALSRAAASLVMGKGLPDDLQGKGLTEADLSPARLRA